MTRRLLFVMIIIKFRDRSGMQLILNKILTLAYILYLIHFKPFLDPNQNNGQIFNDVCILLVSYFLMWQAIFPDFDVSEVDTINSIGWFYIATASFNMVVNLLKLSYSSALTIPK